MFFVEICIRVLVYGRFFFVAPRLQDLKWIYLSRRDCILGQLFMSHEALVPRVNHDMVGKSFDMSKNEIRARSSTYFAIPYSFCMYTAVHYRIKRHDMRRYSHWVSTDRQA